MSGVLALYGNVAIIRGRCLACGGMALVLDGKTQCCDEPFGERPTRVERVVPPEYVRRPLSPIEQREILSDQENRCYLCELEIGSLVYKRGRFNPVRLKAAFDHLVPFSFSQDNRRHNIAAACHVCNGIKRDRMFHTTDEARAAVSIERAAAGWRF